MRGGEGDHSRVAAYAGLIGGVCRRAMLGRMEIGVLGATGPAGRGLAARLADAGFDVIAGSRDEAKASSVVDELRERWGSRVAKLRPGSERDRRRGP